MNEITKEGRVPLENQAPEPLILQRYLVRQYWMIDRAEAESPVRFRADRLVVQGQLLPEIESLVEEPHPDLQLLVRRQLELSSLLGSHGPRGTSGEILHGLITAGGISDQVGPVRPGALVVGPEGDKSRAFAEARPAHRGILDPRPVPDVASGPFAAV